MRNVITFLFCSLVASSLAAAPATDGRHSWQMGVGFSGYRSGAGIGLDFATPRLFAVRPNEKRRSDFHLFLGLEEAWLFGLAAKTTQNLFIVGGLKTQVVFADGIATPYSILAADFVLIDSSLATTNRTSFGLRAGIGCDFLLMRDEDGPFGFSDATFFVEGAVGLLHRGADALPGSPNVFDGFIPRLGFRSHY